MYWVVRSHAEPRAGIPTQDRVGKTRMLIPGNLRGIPSTTSCRSMSTRPLPELENARPPGRCGRLGSETGSLFCTNSFQCFLQLNFSFEAGGPWNGLPVQVRLHDDRRGGAVHLRGQGSLFVCLGRSLEVPESLTSEWILYSWPVQVSSAAI